MLQERASGVLLHPTSLPGRGGIGDLGPEAHRFVDWLAAAGQRVWQVLPLNELGFGASPYRAATSYAGDRRLISPELLIRDELLDPTELPPAPPSRANRVPLEAAAAWKDEILRRSWAAASRRGGDWPAESVRRFRDDEANRRWLDDWTLYAALKGRFHHASWDIWPEAVRRRDPAALERARRDLREEIDYEIFVQFLFFRQWRELHEHAARRGVRILGDLPIYPAPDSADVWADQAVFDLDADGAPNAVAGVPPDYFSTTGQLWGNPLYRWDRLEQEGFTWWIRRFEFLLRHLDMVRLDHFRGFVAHWRVPAGAADARSGRWVPTPGAALFETVARTLGSPPFIAEDLGVITPEVVALRRRFGFPGMKVLQFAFAEPDSEHLPRHHTRDSVVYTGTHDNDTTLGWYRGLDAATRERVRVALGARDDEVPAALLRAATRSVATLAVLPVQDLLGLGSEARMNTPGHTDGNWTWCLERGQLDERAAERLRAWSALGDRLAPDPTEDRSSQPTAAS